VVIISGRRPVLGQLTRVPAMTPGELARRLDRSFAVLAAGRRGAVARHQTLRAAIDWSFQLLARPEQALLARLAVFAGGATLEAIEAVGGGEGIDPDAVLELLAGLVARSLVVAEDHGTQTRYRLLETIRQYGEERLEAAGETQRWRARHASYYAGLLPRIREHAHDPREEVFWAVRLSADQDNLLAAWSWAIGTGNVGVALTILAGFAPCEVWSSYPLLLVGEAALELPGAAGHPGHPLALAVSAVFAAYRGDLTGAEQLCRRVAEANARQHIPDWRCRDHPGRRRNLRGRATDVRSAAQLGPDGSPGRRARQGAPRPRGGHELGPGPRLRPHPHHPGPQRTRTPDPAMSELLLQGDGYGQSLSLSSGEGPRPSPQICTSARQPVPRRMGNAPNWPFCDT
jgi:hypothetical protein